MKKCRRTVALGLAWGVLAWVAGCSRQLATPDSNRSANGQLPFERVSDNGGLSPTDGVTGDGIPARTEIDVRLQTAMSSADYHAGDSFQAVLDEPLVVAGKTILPQGTPVTGNVVAARASGGFNDPGYMRLTLDSILVSGKSVPLRTSNIFAKGGSFDKRKPVPINSSEIKPSAEQSVGDGGEISIHPTPRDVRFSTGHRLTFRLAQPVTRLP